MREAMWPYIKVIAFDAHLYLNTCPKNDVIMSFRKLFCRVRSS